jgi:hypothetical protein
MTNTLHRFGRPANLTDDYIAFILTSRGINDAGAVQKARDFIASAVKHNAVNIAGESRDGSLHRPEKHLNLFSLYVRGRKEKVAAALLQEEMGEPGRALAVFANRQDLEGFLREIKQMDLGLSVNVSSLVDDVREMAPRTGVRPHSINYALGFRGNLHLLPDQYVLALTTMCGHGMIASSFAKKMIDRVKEGRLAPETCAGYMAKFCTCGAFNTARAVHILERARMSKSGA